MDALAEAPHARFSLGNVRTLHADGSTIDYNHDLPPRVPRGLLARISRDTGKMPTAPIAAIWNADLVRSVGGWPGLPRDEDTCLKLAATSVAEGVSVDDIVYVYRRDLPDQATNHSTYDNEGEWCRAVALDRLQGLVRVGLADADIIDGDWSLFLHS